VCACVSAPCGQNFLKYKYRKQQWCTSCLADLTYTYIHKHTHKHLPFPSPPHIFLSHHSAHYSGLFKQPPSLLSVRGLNNSEEKQLWTDTHTHPQKRARGVRWGILLYAWQHSYSDHYSSELPKSTSDHGGITSCSLFLCPAALPLCVTVFITTGASSVFVSHTKTFLCTESKALSVCMCVILFPCAEREQWKVKTEIVTL